MQMQIRDTSQKPRTCWWFVQEPLSQSHPCLPRSWGTAISIRDVRTEWLRRHLTREKAWPSPLLRTGGAGRKCRCIMLTSETASLDNPLKPEKKITSVMDDPRIPEAGGQD